MECNLSPRLRGGLLVVVVVVVTCPSTTTTPAWCDAHEPASIWERETGHLSLAKRKHFFNGKRMTVWRLDLEVVAGVVQEVIDLIHSVSSLLPGISMVGFWTGRIIPSCWIIMWKDLMWERSQSTLFPPLPDFLYIDPADSSPWIWHHQILSPIWHHHLGILRSSPVYSVAGSEECQSVALILTPAKPCSLFHWVGWGNSYRDADIERTPGV